MSNEHSQSELVIELAEEFIARFRRGERPTVAEYVQRHPHLAEQIRETFPAMAMVEHIALDDESLEKESTKSIATPQGLTQIGDYRIIREVGRGGMGIVYEAEQISLGRRVAVKILPKNLFSSGKIRQRFERESKAAAKLHHTNIVPVFGVGEEDGIHYYVMQFIQGLGLDEVLEELRRQQRAAANDKNLVAATDQNLTKTLNLAPPGQMTAEELPQTTKPIANPPHARRLHEPSQVSVEIAVQSLMEGRFSLDPPKSSTHESENFDSGSNVTNQVTDRAQRRSPKDNSLLGGAGSVRVGSETDRGETQLPSDGASALAPLTSRADTVAKANSETAGSGPLVLPGRSEATSQNAKRGNYYQSVANIGLQVADALQHAHQQNIIHRDVKPSNLLLDTRGNVWVTDFGLAKASDQRDLTQTGDVLGTLRYMAPEQFEGVADFRSDIYALGLTLYELLAFRPAFAEKDRHKLIKQVIQGSPERLRSLDARLPTDLTTIIHKAIERDPRARYQTAGELKDDLYRFLHDEPVHARRISPATRFTRWCKRNPAVAGLTTTILVLVTAAAVISTSAAVWFKNLATDNAQLVVQVTNDKAKAQSAQKTAEDAREAERLLRISADEAKKVAEAAKRDADEQRKLANERESLARRNLYAAHMNLAQAAWERTDIPRALDFLQRHVPAPGEQDWRSFEWYYLLGQCTQDELTIICNHSGARPAFSPDGRVLAVSVYRKQIELWDLERRERSQVIVDATCRGPVAFSPDGKTLASVGQGEVKLWDVATGTHLRSLAGHEHEIMAVSFTPDGAKIVSADGGTVDTKNIPGVIRVWDVATGERLHELKGYSKFIYSIAISPDGTRLASGGFDGGRIWDLLTGKPIEGLKVIGGWFAVAWSPDGKSIATYGSEIQNENGAGDIVIWDAATGKETARFAAPILYSLAYSPDGLKLASNHKDSTIRLWEVKSGQQLEVFKGHSQMTFYVTYSPDGKRLASVGRDTTVKVWPVDRTDPMQSLTGSSRKWWRQPGRDRMRLSPDGSYLTAMQDLTTVSIIDVCTGAVRAKLAVGKEVHAMSISRDGRRLAVAHASGIEIWDVATAQPVREHTTASAVWTIAFSPDGLLLAVGTDARQVEIFHADTLARQRVLPWQYKTPLGKIVFSPDGKRLAVASTTEPADFHLWDTQEWRLRSALEFNDKNVTDVAFSQDGKMIAVSEGDRFQLQDGAVTRILDAIQGTELAALQGDDAYHTAVVFSSDGNTLATASESGWESIEGKITFWDLQTHEERTTLQWAGHAIESLALTPDGRTLISSDDHARVRIWRPATEERVDQTVLAGLYRRATRYAADNRWQDAADLLSHLLKGGDDLIIRASRGRAFAELGQWNEAAADFEQVVRSGGTGYRPLYELALVHLIQGQEAAYQKACAEMLDRFRETRDGATAEFVCWTNSLGPQPELDWGQLVSLAAVPFAEGDPGSFPWTTFGAVLLRAGLYEDALVELQAAGDAVLQDRGRTTADYTWYMLAQAHARMGNLKAAKTCLEKTEPVAESDATERSPSTASEGPQWFRRATLQLLRNQTNAEIDALKVNRPDENATQPSERSRRALAIYSRAIELRKDIPILWRLRAQAHERLGASAESAADLAWAEQLDLQLPLRRLNALVSGNRGDDVVVNGHFVLERALYRFNMLSDYDGALKDCFILMGSENTMNDGPAFDLFFKVQQARGTLDRADVDWHREFGGDQIAAFYKARAEYFRKQGNHAKADEDLARMAWAQDYQVKHDAWKARPDSGQRVDPWPHLLEARDQRMLGQNEKADSEIAAATAAAPDDPQVWLALARLQEQWGVQEVAVEASWAKAIELAGDDPSPLIQRGRRYFERGDHEKADADFGTAAALTTEHPHGGLLHEVRQPHAFRSWNFAATENGWQNGKGFQCTFELSDGILAVTSTGGDPQLIWDVWAPPGWKELTLCARFHGDLDNAALLWATSKEPEFSGNHGTNFRLVDSGGQWRVYRVFFNPDADLSSLRFDPEDRTGLRIDLAWIVLANRTIEESIALNPNDDQLVGFRGEQNLKERRWEEAVTDFTSVLEKDPANARYLLKRARAFLGQGDYVRALTDAEALVALNPNQVNSYDALAEIHAAQGHWQEAIDAVDKQIELEPQKSEHWYKRAVVLATGLPDAYRTYCDELLAKYSDSPNNKFLSHVAWCCALRDGGVEGNAKLLPLARTLEVAFPDDWTWSYPTTVIQYRNGQYPEALARLNRAVAPGSIGDSPWEWMLLAMTHFRMGNRDEALKWFEKLNSTKGQEDERSLYWVWRLEVQLLKREAAELLGVDPESPVADSPANNDPAPPPSR